MGQQSHKQHTQTVQHIVLGCQSIRLTCTLIVKAGAQQCFRIVTVRPMIGPLSLSLETACDGIVTNHLFFASFGQILITCHQILDDTIHLNSELPLLFLLLICKTNEIRVVITAHLTVLLGPCKSLLILFLVVNTFFHSAQNLYFIYRLYSHAQIRLYEILIHNGTADTHTLGTDLQIRLTSHGSNCYSCTAES